MRPLGVTAFVMTAVAVATTGCERREKSEAAPSVSPATRPVVESADLDARVPLAVGQWTRHRRRDATGAESVLVYRIVAQERNAFVLDVTEEGGSAPRRFQFLIDAGERASPDAARLVAIRIQLPNGELRELRGGAAAASGEQHSRSLAAVGLGPIAGQREDVTVTAGTFRGCYRRRVEGSLSGAKTPGTAWNHPAVPITGLVKSVADDGATVELVGSGREPSSTAPPAARASAGAGSAAP